MCRSSGLKSKRRSIFFLGLKQISIKFISKLVLDTLPIYQNLAMNYAAYRRNGLSVVYIILCLQYFHNHSIELRLHRIIKKIQCIK